MKRIWLVAVMAASALTAAPAPAQLFTPTFQAPRSSSDVGIYLSDGPGDLAVEGIFRRGFGGYDLGLRVGIADTDDASLLIGGELRNPLAAGTAPLDLALTAGAQAMVGGGDALGVQGGLSIGSTLRPGGFTLTPYVHPRIALVNALGGEDDLELDLLADVGLDFGFRSGLALRIGIAIGEVEGPDAGLGVGLSWR